MNALISGRYLPSPGLDIFVSLAKLAMRENVRLYLVGGTVRDLLLGKEVEDLDFAVAGDALGFARKFADLEGASFVPLDEEQGTARVVFRGELETCPYMDFSRIRGSDIVEDLAARDFTINSMAIDFSQVTGGTGIPACELAVIDPHSGTEDLNNRLIRLVSPRSIEDDPIRMLRAYRFAATLDFRIDDATSLVIQNSLKLLDSVSAERVRDELFKILAVDNSLSYLEAMDDVGLLEQIFPEIARMKGMEQNDYHHLDVWGHSILTLEYFEHGPLPDFLKSYLSEAEDYLDHELVRGRPRRSLLKLAALLHDVGKPDTRTMDRNGRIRFFDHNVEGAEIIGDIGRRLKLATRETSFLKNVIRDHMYPLGLSVFLRKPEGMKRKKRALRRFIQRTGAEWLAILLISFADLRATQGPRRGASDLEDLVRLIGEITDAYFQETRHPIPKLVTGNDLMAEFDLPPSPLIGELLKRVEEAQIDGTIKTRDDAIEMIRSFLSRRNWHGDQREHRNPQ
jgi:poly(A) polymerase